MKGTGVRTRLGLILFGLGVGLLGEHVYYYGASFTWPPIWNHGLYGLIAIVISFALLAKREPRSASKPKPTETRGAA